MKHEESRLQQACVAWFRAQYPMYAMLLTHPSNEGNGKRVTGAIHKAEGLQPGVPDLLLFVPNESSAGLGIELKTEKGRQSQAQQDFQAMFETAGYEYCVVRSLDQFMQIVKHYLMCVPGLHYCLINEKYKELQASKLQCERDHMKKITSKTLK